MSRRVAGTYRNYREQLRCAVNILGADLSVGELRRIRLRRLSSNDGQLHPAHNHRYDRPGSKSLQMRNRSDLLVTNPVVGYWKLHLAPQKGEAYNVAAALEYHPLGDRLSRVFGCADRNNTDCEPSPNYTERRS